MLLKWQLLYQLVVPKNSLFFEKVRGEPMFKKVNQSPARSMMFLFGMISLIFFVACKQEMKGPKPEVTSLDPALVCVEQLVTEVVVHGSGLSPTVFDTLADKPTVQLPKITLTHLLELSGTSGTGQSIIVPDDPKDPEASRVQWIDKSTMAFDVYPELELASGVWGITIENPNKESVTFENALLAVDPPILDAVVPDIVCNVQGERTIELQGQNFLVIGTTTPIADISGTTYATTFDSADCIDLPGPIEDAKLCTVVSVTVPTSVIEGMHPISVQNPSPAGCTTTNEQNLFVLPPPTLTSVEPANVCLASGATAFQVTGSNFVVIDDGVNTSFPTLNLDDGAGQVIQQAVIDMADMQSSCSAYPTSGPAPTETVQTCTSFLVTIDDDTILEATTFVASVENPMPIGCSSENSPDITVKSLPPPTVASPSELVPVQLCQGGGEITLAGSNLFENAVVRVGGLKAESVDASSAICDSNGLCDGLVANFGFFPTNVVGQDLDLLVSNSEDDRDLETPNICAITIPAAVSVISGPLVLYVDPPTIYDGIDNRLTVYATNFLAGNVTHVELVPPTADSNIVLCDDEGATPCENLSSTTSGRFHVTVPANTLAGLTGAPSQGSFGIEVYETTGVCAGQLPEAFTILSEQEQDTELAIDPSIGKQGEKTAVTISMTEPVPGLFSATPRVFMTSGTSGGALEAVSFVSNDTLNAVVPDTFTITGDFDDFDLIVVTPDGKLIIEQGIFSLSNFSPPIIDTVTPGQVPSTGQTVTVTGENFQDPGGVLENTPVAALIACQDENGAELTGNTPTVTFVSTQQLTLDVVPPVGGWNFAACAVEITNPRDQAKAVYSSLVFAAANSGNIPATRDAATSLNYPRQGLGVASIGANRASRFLYAVGGKTGSRASVTSTLAQPFALSDGMTLTVIVDGGAEQTATFNTADFIDIAAATAEEVVDVLIADIVEPASNPPNFMADGGAIVMASGMDGTAGSIEVTANGTATAIFDFPTGTFYGVDADVLSSVEYVPLNLKGDLGSAFKLARYSLNTKRVYHGLFEAGRALYAVGGEDESGIAVSTTERAVVLDPSEVVAPELTDFAFGTEEDPGLLPGGWIYRVSIVFDDTDLINPCGESLPSEPFVFVIPDVTDGLWITLSWDKPDTTTPGSNWTNRVIAGYRIYRTTQPDQGAADIEFLADRVASDLPEFEDKETVTSDPFPNCTDFAPVAGQKPLEIGETSRWVEVPALELNQARKGPGYKSVPDRTSNKIFFYVISGLDENALGIDDYEYMVLQHNADTNPLDWESGASWTQELNPLFDFGVGGSCKNTNKRWLAGLFLFNRESSSKDGTSFAIDTPYQDEQFLYLGPGRKDTGVETGALQSWRIDATTGELDQTATVARCEADAATSGYGNIGANQQVFLLGGTKSKAAVKAAEWIFDAGPPPFIDLLGGGFDDNGSFLDHTRSTHGTLLDRAFIYMVGGFDGANSLDTVEYGLW